LKLARVVGNALATIKHPALFGQRLLLIDEERPDGTLHGRPRMALDSVDAGEVTVCSSSTRARRRPGDGTRAVRCRDLAWAVMRSRIDRDVSPGSSLRMSPQRGDKG
jgi:microcompartment protein CcmK/EutM